jgi:hypothetical protein
LKNADKEENRGKAMRHEKPHFQRSPEEKPACHSEAIAKRAYELYESRERQDGFALHDWLQAEQEISHGAPQS